MREEDLKIFEERLGKGRLVELTINPTNGEISVIDLQYSEFDGIGRQIHESFEPMENNDSKAIQLIGMFFPWVKTAYRYLDCLDGFAETDEAKNWTVVYHSEANGKDIYDCSFKYIIALEKMPETTEIEGFSIYFD